MWKKFLKKFFSYFFGYGAFFLILGFWLFSFNNYVWIPLVFIVAVVSSYSASKNIFGEYKQKYEEEAKQKEQAQKETKLWKASLIEKGAGFPTLLQAVEQYDKIKDEKIEQFLRYKSHPSRKGAEVVKEEARRRRLAEYENKKTQAIIEYYESIAPFLVDLKNDIVDFDDEEKYREYDEEERFDPITQYLTKEEFRKLSSVERNQMALDRFWSRPKLKWLLGRIYERYVGYLYEMKGYDVDYVGIFKGYEDLGRDLICQKGNDFIIIQCKNWSQFKTIYEKHIFQFFGTVFQYKDENPNKKVKAIFYTTTKLSDLARRFAQELGIELQENFKFEKAYPSIKCNISRIDGTKIYHLPFDQQYDKVKIEKKRGEFYCAEVKEAEEYGFRRAFRYKGGNTPVRPV
ncbi:MAG: restriction endonuclease [bacterium]